MQKNHRFKALYWDKDSFILVYRRIGKGHLEWPQN
ncbi:IS66 family insertion sequence element accessory protein TnpB [Turicibacter bilis]